MNCIFMLFEESFDLEYIKSSVITKEDELFIVYCSCVFIITRCILVAQAYNSYDPSINITLPYG